MDQQCQDSNIMSESQYKNQIDPQISQIQESEIDLSLIEEQDLSIEDLISNFFIDIENNDQILEIRSQGKQLEEENFDFQDQFIIRQYQMEMYEKAKNKNSIIYLETGLGKTLILIMVMWYKLQCNPEKKVIFLANTVHLVEQQTAQIKSKLVRVADMLGDSEEDIQRAIQLTKQVQAIHGSKYTDSWNITMWKLLLERNLVFVMTSQLFLNCLRQGIVKLSQFSLVIMDECHSASANHQYNDIMREFYFPLKTKLVEAGKLADLPQIMGATASPAVQKKIYSGKELVSYLLGLAAILDSFYIYQDKYSIGQYMNSAQITYLEYENILNNEELQQCIDQNAPTTSIFDPKKGFYQIILKSGYLDEYFEIKKLIHYFNYKYESLPQILIMLQQIYKYLIGRGFHLYMDIGPIVLVFCLEYTNQQIQSFIDAEPGFEYISQIKDIQNQLQSITKAGRFKLRNLSPKVSELLKFLTNIYKVKKQQMPMGLIFVKSRATAKYLNMVIQKYFEQNNISIFQYQQIQDIQTDFIIGHRVPQRSNKGKKTDLSYSISKDCTDENLMIKSLIDELSKNHTQYFKNQPTENIKKLLLFRNSIDYNQQITKIQNFKDGNIQLLIATSVAEEGIDLPSCNYVIGFTTIQSSKALVQMKGRARQKDSQFIVMIPKTFQSRLRIDSMKQVQSLTQDVIAKLSKQPDTVFQQKLTQLQNQIKIDKYYESYSIESTGACVNTDWSKHLIHLFCQSINTADHGRGTPKFIIFNLKDEKSQVQNYVCFVQIPIQLKQFIFCGSLQKDVKDAKNSACFKAITTLIGQGYIDEYLRPSFTNDVGLQLGADEDDCSIQLTKEQILILEQCSKKQQKSQNINQVGIICSKRLYKQNIQYYFCRQKIKNCRYYRYSIVFANQLIYLYLSEFHLKFIRNCSEMLSIVNVQLNNIEIIEYSEYCEKYLLYQNCIFQEIELLDLRENYHFKDIQYNDIMFLYNQSYNGKYLELYLLIQKCIQAQRFYEKIANVKLTKTIVTDQVDSTMPKLRNLILENIDQYLKYFQVDILKNTFESDTFEIVENSQFDDSCILQKSEKSTIETQEQQSNTSSEEITQIPQQEMPLNKIILSSLSNQYEFKHLMIGSSYFKLMLSIQLFSSNLEQNTKIIEIRQKTYQSATFIRNQLLEIKLFENLHNENQNLSQIYSGLLKIYEEGSEDFDQYTHLSNQTFLQFLQQSCYLIQQFDEKMMIGFEWLKQLGITNQILSTISSTDHLRNHLNTTTKTNNYVQQLKFHYQGLEQQLDYKFNCFEILFRSMVDESVQYNYNIIKQQNATKRINPNYSFYDYQMNETNEMLLNDLEYLYEDFEALQTYDVENYGNAQLGQLGKKLWNHLISKYVVNLDLNDIQIMIAKKNLKSLQFLAALSVKLSLDQYFNFGQISNEVRQNYEKLSKQKDLAIEKLINLIDNNDSTKILANCYYALIAAIFLDSNCDMNLMNELSIKLIESVNGQIMCSIEQLLIQPKYLFLRWYQNNFGNAVNFDLIKIPYLDYHKMARGFSLYLPYDVKNSTIINVLKDKLINLKQLHIYATSKIQAWELLLKMVHMN